MRALPHEEDSQFEAVRERTPNKLARPVAVVENDNAHVVPCQGADLDVPVRGRKFVRDFKHDSDLPAKI